MRHKVWKNGFTLVEVLVAVFIFSIIMLTLFSSFSALISSGQFIAGTLAEEGRARMALKRIETDLRMMFITRPPRYRAPGIADDADPYRFLGGQERIGGRTFSRLAFASRAHVKTGGAGYESIARITYYVGENRNGGYNLYRSDRPVADTADPDPCRDPVLARNIRIFKMSFLDQEGAPKDEWDSDTDRDDYRMPEKIGLTLGFVSQEGVQQVDTMFLIPVNREDS